MNIYSRKSYENEIYKNMSARMQAIQVISLSLQKEGTSILFFFSSFATDFNDEGFLLCNSSLNVGTFFQLRYVRLEF
jgi:hypothetical protein